MSVLRAHLKNGRKLVGFLNLLSRYHDAKLKALTVVINTLGNEFLPKYKYSSVLYGAFDLC